MTLQRSIEHLYPFEISDAMDINDDKGEDVTENDVDVIARDKENDVDVIVDSRGDIPKQSNWLEDKMLPLIAYLKNIYNL